MNRNTILIIFVLVVVVLGGVFAFQYYQGVSEQIQQVQKGQNTRFSTPYQEGRSLFISGDYGNAAMQFNEALKNAVSKTEEALARLNIGTTFMASNPSKGIALLKEMSLDESLPVRERADAIRFVASHYISGKDIDFAFNHIFTGEKWSTFIEDASRDRNSAELAARRAYEWSADLFSTFNAEYRIAWWYAKQIKSGLVDDNLTEEYAEIIQNRINRGDAALISNKTTRISQLGLGLNRKGIALEGLYLLGKVDEQEVIDAYLAAIATYESAPSNDIVSKKSLLFSRYHLAAFLADLPDVDPEEIKNILEQTHSIINASFFRFLREYANVSIFGTDPTRQDIINLALIDPQFKQVLLELDWQESDFE